MESLYKREKWFRTALWVALALAVACLWSWGARETDTYSVQVKGNECRIDTYESDPETGYEQYCGQMIGEFKRETLVPGTYVLNITYGTEADGGWFEVVDPETHALLAKGDYAPGQTSVSVTFERKNGQYGMAVRSYQGEDQLQISEYKLCSQGPVYTDTFWILGLFAFLALFAYGCLCRQRAGKPQDLQLLVLACVFSLPYLSDHLQNGHDLAFHAGRIAGIGTALRSGQFPVRLDPDLFSAIGGYADPIMYPNLFLYFSGVMCALGASVLLAVKVMYILINFLTVYCGYYGAKQLVGDEGGMAFTILYMCCPYRLNDIFIRAAVGEALAMAFLPLAAAGIWQLVQGDYKKGFWSALLGITGVLQTHIISAFLVVFFGALYGVGVLIWQGRRFWTDRRRPFTLLAAAGATLMLNAWSLVPLVQFSSRLDFAVFRVWDLLKEMKVYPWQVFMETYTPGGISYGTQSQNQMPISIGRVLLLYAVLMVYRWLREPRCHSREITLEKCLFGLGTLALFMASMAFPWAKLEKLTLIQKTFDRIQFPWRLLTVTAVLYCLAAAVETVLLRKEQKQVAVGILVALAIVSAVNAGSQYFFSNSHFQLDKTADRQRRNYDNAEYLFDVPNKRPATVALEGILPLTDGAQADGYDRQATDLSFAFTNADPAQAAVFRLPQYNYTLHRATLADGQVLAIDTDPETGLMLLTVPAGITEGTVQVRYHAPLSFRLAEGISLLAAALLVLLRWRKQPPRKTAAAH